MFFGSVTVDLDIKDQFLETLIQVSSEADILAGSSAITCICRIIVDSFVLFDTIEKFLLPDH